MKNSGFEKLIFNDKEEEKSFDKYTKLKGIYLHKQIYDILLEYNPDIVTYREMSSIIKYDKNLRDHLYIYLATFEEYLRSNIFEKYDVQSEREPYHGTQGLNKLKKEIKKKQNNNNSNLYYLFELDLGSTIDLMDHLKMYDKAASVELDHIRKLRNNVMHHGILVLGKSTTKNNAEENILKLQEQVKSLCKHLPEDYKKRFATEINNLNTDKKSKKQHLDKLYLGEIKWNM